MKFCFLLAILLTISSSCSLMKGKKSEPSIINNVPQESVATDFDFDLDVKRVVLENGLTVLIVENDFLPIFTYFTFYKVGAKFESKGIVGGSHFLEHLMFKGAKKYGMGAFDQTIESNGGTNNAFTSMDLTVYYDNLPVRSLEKIIDLESDRMQGILLDPVGFEKEREVILEERKVRYENRPSGKLFLELSKEVFRQTPYGRSVIGESDEIKEMTREGIFEYYKNFYSPNNAVVVVSGGVDSGETLNLIKKYYGNIAPSSKLQASKDLRGGDLPYPHSGRYGTTIKIRAEAPNPKFMLAYKAFPQGTRESQVVDILSYILGSGDSSFLVQKYVKGKQIRLVDIYSFPYTMQNSGVFFIGGELLSGVNLQTIEASLKRDLKESCELAINDRSVQKTKNQIWVEFYNGLQTNDGIGRYLGTAEAIMGDYKFYKKELETYQSITTEEVIDLCKSTFVKNNGIFASVWNKHPKNK